MTSVPTRSGLVAEARRAVDDAHRAPADALTAAMDLLDRADGDDEVSALACWAAGLASREMNRLPEADGHLLRAIAAAARFPAVAAGARTSRALVLANLGRTSEALAELDLAEPMVDGAERSRVVMQRALILQRQGRLAEAIAGFADALPGLVAAGDEVAESRLRINFGIALGYLGELHRADEELQAARTIARRLGQSMLAAMCAQNLGFVNGRRGDVPAALTWFDAAADEYSDLGVEAGLAAVLLVDRATVLLDAGLTAEAVTATSRAVQLLEPTGNSAELAEADLLAARAQAAAGDEARAAASAQRAATAFRSQQRSSWAVLAEYVQLQTGGAVDAAALANRLDAAGWTVEAAAAHGIAGQLAAQAGDLELARAELTVAARSRDAAPAAARVAGWHAAAVREQLLGNRRGLRRAVRAGLGELQRHRATLSATDLRAHSAHYGQQLADLAVADALAAGRPADVLVAAEAWRAGALSNPAVPPPDPQLAELLGSLRAATARRREEPSGEADRALQQVEDAVRDLVRSRPGAGGTAVPRAFDRSALIAGLDDRVLIEWVSHRGQLHAVVVDRGRTSHLELGPLAAAVDAVASIRMCLQRLAIGAGSARSLVAARTTLAAASADAERALLGPLCPRLADRRLVLVPTGALHATPWLALDAVRARPTAVAPSAQAWLAASGRIRRPGVLLAAGPGLPGAAAEVAALSSALPDAVALGPGDATVSAVLDALDGAGVAHIAAHGHFRADNPQFSALSLADGDLTVYDLELLPRVPELLVLSACDAAATGVRAGDELLGLTAALLAAGASTLVAPSVPVPDDVTAPLMVTLQLLVADGVDPATALRDAVAAADGDGHTDFAAARSFVAWGA